MTYCKSSWVWCEIFITGIPSQLTRSGDDATLFPHIDGFVFFFIQLKKNNFKIAFFSPKTKYSVERWDCMVYGVLLIPLSANLFQQQKKNCPWMSLTNRPVYIWVPCFVSEKTSNRKEKRKTDWLFCFLPECVVVVVVIVIIIIIYFIAVLYIVLSIFHLWALFRICTSISEFRMELRFLENLSLGYDLHNNCLVIVKTMERKRSVCQGPCHLSQWFQSNAVIEGL